LTFGGLLKDVSQQSAHRAGLAKGLLARTRSISARMSSGTSHRDSVGSLWLQRRRPRITTGKLRFLRQLGGAMTRCQESHESASAF
jgi:hypothetical protein